MTTTISCKTGKYLVLMLILLFAVSLSKAQLKASFNANTLSGCAPLVVSFTDNSTGSPTSWRWDLGNGTTSIFQNPSTSYFNPGTYTVKLIIRNALGVDSVTKVQYVTVYSAPDVNFSGTPVSGCFPMKAQFTDLSSPGSGTVAKWEWDFGDGNTSDLKNPNHTYTATGNYNVSLRVTNSFGCVSSKNISSYINIGSGVKSLFSNSNPNSCSAPATIQFYNYSSGTGSLSYVWNFGDGSNSTLPNPSHTYTSPGSFTVSLITRSTTGCADTLIIPNLITLGTTKADFSVPATICQGSPVSFSNTSSPAPGGAFWDFGDGTTSNAINPIKTYSRAGSFTISMEANFGACKDVIKKTVQVVAKPVVDFTASPTSSCKAPFTVNFKNTSSGGATYLWDFGDGTTSDIENASHTYNSPGTYSVKLIVTNASGCKDSIKKTDLIKIKAPVVTILNLPQRGCAPLTNTFTAAVNSLDPITTYSWDFGDGSSSNSVSPTHVYNTPGKYTITLTYTTEGGCTESVKITDGIIVGSKPKANLSANPQNACASQIISFMDLTTGNPDEWFWYFGDGGTSSNKTPTYQYNDTGNFSVTLIAFNNGCADTITLPKYIYIKPPIARFYYNTTCTVPRQTIFSDNSIGADTWNWDFGDGTTSSAKNPIHTYPTPGVYTVTLTVTNQSTGCSYTTKQQVTIIREIADFTVSSAVVCKNTPVTFTATQSNPSNVRFYTWRFGDGTTISTASPSIIHYYTKAGSYNVTLTVTDINGCTESVTKNSAVQVDGPTANFQSSVSGICLNSTLNFTDGSQSDGVHDIKQWSWNWGDGTSQTLTTPPFNHTYTSPGYFSVYLKVTDSKGCTDSIFRTNFIYVSKPEAIFSADVLSCTASPIRFYNSSTGPGLSYSWDFGDGSISTQSNPVHLYTTEGTYTVSLSIKDIYGCTSSSTKTNYIKIANPVADFSVNNSTGSCPPLVVNFSNTSLNYFSSSWSFGDGTSSLSASPSHFYNSVGTFNAVLTVYGPGGCTSQKTMQIKVDGPKGSFSYKNTSGCIPLKTDFEAQTENNASFIWDFNDGAITQSPDAVISHSYATPGNYLPKMILVDAKGCQVPVTGTETINVYGVEASFSHTGELVCNAQMVQFTNTSVSNDPIINYKWDFGDGSISAQQNPFHLYNVLGIYNTSLSVTTLHGCKDTLFNPLPVKVNRRPQTSIDGITGACEPAVLKFSGNISNPDTSSISWKWDFANGNASTLQNPPSQTYPKAGNYNVQAIVVSSNGCKDTVIKTVEIYPLPVLKTSSDDVVCAGSSANLQASGAQSYLWSPSTYLSCNTCDNPIARPDSSIKYSVKGTSNKGCVSMDSVSLVVKHPFKISVSKEDSLCLGKSVQLTAGGTEKYTWTPSTGLDNPFISSPKASPAITTIYQVVGSDNKGCFTDTGYIPISVFPVPVVNAGADKTINVGQQTEIIPTISNDVTELLWTPSTGIISKNYPGIIVKPIESTEYTIEVKNIGGCKATDKISVFVVCNNANIFVPNTFSPNGDGANDIFFPRGSGLFKIKNLKIFNRWGEIIFERSNFNANDASAGWDGTYKGKKLPPDVFVYMLEVVCDNNANLLFKGNVALIK